jgi:hypothetical protein
MSFGLDLRSRGGAAVGCLTRCRALLVDFKQRACDPRLEVWFLVELLDQALGNGCNVPTITP